jgi:hypothetical protein
MRSPDLKLLSRSLELLNPAIGLPPRRSPRRGPHGTDRMTAPRFINVAGNAAKRANVVDLDVHPADVPAKDLELILGRPRRRL